MVSTLPARTAPSSPSPSPPGAAAIIPASSPHETMGPHPQLSLSGSLAHPLGSLCIERTVPPLWLPAVWLRVRPQGSCRQIEEEERVSATLLWLQKRSRIWKPSQLMYRAPASEHREG